mmetsp:Transcript_28756/g.63391  ORF Transcript_28756/g.63391 Transcript_28756/m.63391 type:complete len:262 (-) Transcript_28756:420-1205(-)
MDHVDLTKFIHKLTEGSTNLTGHQSVLVDRNLLCDSIVHSKVLLHPVSYSCGRAAGDQSNLESKRLQGSTHQLRPRGVLQIICHFVKNRHVDALQSSNLLLDREPRRATTGIWALDACLLQNFVQYVIWNHNIGAAQHNQRMPLWLAEVIEPTNENLSVFLPTRFLKQSVQCINLQAVQVSDAVLQYGMPQPSGPLPLMLDFHDVTIVRLESGCQLVQQLQCDLPFGRHSHNQLPVSRHCQLEGVVVGLGQRKPEFELHLQ